MIVPMKKVTLLALRNEERDVLESLRDLGVMQVTLNSTLSGDSGELRERADQLRRTASALRQFAADGGYHVPETSSDMTNGADTAETVSDLLARRSALNAEESSLRRRLEELELLGDFDGALLADLRKNGVNVIVCLGSSEDFERARAAEDVTCCELSRRRGRVAFAVVAPEGADVSMYPAMRIGKDEDPRKLSRRLDEVVSEQRHLRRRLTVLIKQCAAIDAAAAAVTAKLDFSRVRDSLAEHGEIMTLSGFVPAPEMERIAEAAKRFGWGFMASDPEEGDNVPVLIQNTKFSRFIKPLFDFLDIIPGYRELDLSGVILIFFTIFYAMIIGDAGYGLLFLAGTGIAMWRLRGKPAARMPLKLMLILSIASIVWGVLCGSYFGVSWGGVKYFADPKFKDKGIQLFCFILAVAQLTAGHLFQSFRNRQWRNVGANLGWTLVIWGNFLLTVLLLVKPEGFNPLKVMYALYGVGLALILVCGLNWKNPADLFQFPFSVIGSFTDVLSYIRLFAVGMAGACIAQSFNGMGTGVIRSNPWLFLLGVVVIVFGHLLNIALAMMSVLVHAVRLNTLEFSNHAGLSWSGQKFTPFKHNNKEGNEIK